MTGHEEVGDGSSEVEHGTRAERTHELGDLPQVPQVLGDGHKGQDQQAAVPLDLGILAQHVEHVVLVLLVDDDAAILLAHEVEEGAGVVRVVARVGQQRELAVQEDDGVAMAEEELGAGGATRAGREVVNVAHRLGLEGHRGAAGCDEDDAAALVVVAVDELAGEGDVSLEVLGRGLVGEVIALRVAGHGADGIIAGAVGSGAWPW